MGEIPLWTTFIIHTGGNISIQFAGSGPEIVCNCFQVLYILPQSVKIRELLSPHEAHSSVKVFR